MTELYKRLEEYRDSDYYPFHMPGHKRQKEAAKGVLADIYGLDITEIDGFDNLHQAQGILREQQERAAKIYGSEKTYFLVNGSTGGILSAIAAVTKKGDRLLMARNCHRSVYHAVYLQELETSFLYPELVREYGIADAVAPEAVEQALEASQDIAAVVVTSPTYEGVAADIRKIADIVHRYGKPLIVDEAHGAHFGFHEAYPKNSVELGADIVIHSVHKTLPAMTQAALLHVNGDRVDRDRLERNLRIFQTSSPSYVLMASISSCLGILENEGWQRLDRLKDYRNELVRRMESCKHLKIAVRPESGSSHMAGLDICKLVLYTADASMTGQQLYDILRERYHLQMEMAADSYVLGIITMMDTQEGMDRLFHALSGIDRSIGTDLRMKADQRIGRRIATQKAAGGSKDRTVMTIAQAYDEPAEQILLESAAGRVAAEFINLYPPGIPLMVPGESFDGDIIELLMLYENMHLNVQGITDGYVKVVESAG